jgi:hypothetical protein
MIFFINNNNYFFDFCRRRKTYLTPAAVQEDRAKVASLESFGITIQEYQTAYEKMILPNHTKLNSEGVKYLCESQHLIPYYHLYTQKECVKEFEKLMKNGKIKQVIDTDNITRYVLPDNPENSKFSF